MSVPATSVANSSIGTFGTVLDAGNYWSPQNHCEVTFHYVDAYTSWQCFSYGHTEDSSEFGSVLHQRQVALCSSSLVSSITFWRVMSGPL